MNRRGFLGQMAALAGLAALAPMVGKAEVSGTARYVPGPWLTFEGMQADCEALGCQGLDRLYHVFSSTYLYRHNGLNSHIYVEDVEQENLDHLADVDAWRRSLHDQAT